MKLKQQVVSYDLKNYIEKTLYPIYDTLDKAHNVTHIKNVIKRSLKLAVFCKQNLNFNMVFAIAAYHDIGLVNCRNDHANFSAKIVREDETLKQWFDKSEIEIMAQAVQDHSASKNVTPRSIYGKIVSDGDKDFNQKTLLKRIWDFTQHHFSHWTESECYDNCFNYFYSKFGKNGKVKFYILDPVSKRFLKRMQKLSGNKPKFVKLLKKCSKTK